MGKLEGRVAIITGTSSGLGRATAIAFAREGAKLAICARRKEKLQKTAEDCEKEGAEVLSLQCDVTNYDDLKNLVDATMEKFGRIDILVNNAVSATQVISIMDHTDEMWDSVMNSGLKASWDLMRLCQPIMMEQKYGKIINISSATAFQGSALFGAYVAAKAAIMGLTMVAAREWGPYINVNCLSPLAVTEQSDRGFAKMPQEAVEAFVPPLGRVGDALEDVAPCMVFLASEDSRYVTGQNLNVDGGLEIHL
ncbi:MAG: SDR family oxidoreductase [Lacrimispora sp.]|uniref:SDR family NAD(P)-dependent oxidoreductase n=1 Tax=Lacrimispora sp. TaxID=2719234 RepID=UPI0039E6180E